MSSPNISLLRLSKPQFNINDIKEYRRILVTGDQGKTSFIGHENLTMSDSDVFIDIKEKIIWIESMNLPTNYEKEVFKQAQMHGVVLIDNGKNIHHKHLELLTLIKVPICICF